MLTTNSFWNHFGSSALSPTEIKFTLSNISWLSLAWSLSEKLGLNLSGCQNLWCWRTVFLIFVSSTPWSKTRISCSTPPLDGQQISLYRRILFDFLNASRFCSLIAFNYSACSVSDCFSVFWVPIPEIAFLILISRFRNSCCFGRRIRKIEDIYSKLDIGKSILFRFL